MAKVVILNNSCSAGGNLSLALLQLLLQLRRDGTAIQWYGEAREVPLPAAVACNSPWLDITQSSPSWDGETPAAAFDYLPNNITAAKAQVKPCDIWPATPPRKWLYVDDVLATHPLASVIMSQNWEGAPPIYICTGWEILALEDKFLAKRLVGEGVTVVFEEYEAMPHCFAMILDKLPNARRCFDGWAAFIRQAVEDAGAIRSRAVEVKAKTLEEVPLVFENLSQTSEEEIRERVQTKAGFKTAAKL